MFNKGSTETLTYLPLRGFQVPTLRRHLSFCYFTLASINCSATAVGTRFGVAKVKSAISLTLGKISELAFQKASVIAVKVLSDQG